MSNRIMQNLPPKARQTTLSTQATPFGCCNFFDECADGIFSLYYRGGLDLLDWMSFKPTENCYRSVDFISYVRPEQAAGVDTHGWIASPCTDPNGIEFGACSLNVEDFGLYGREGPVRELLKPKNYCKNSPRYFFDGTPVESESQWDMFFTMDQILNDIRVGLVTGNSATDGQFDGLQRWVRTGYDCSSLDSYVVDWNGNAMDGTGGGAITLNGAAVAGTYDIVDFLLDLNRNINQRLMWSPLLSAQAKNGVDKILLLPSFMARCLLDFYTCWSVCPDTDQSWTLEMRDFRNSLNGGRFGYGKIYLDGEEISLLTYDWGMINGPTTGDMYLLTGAVGSQRIWEGEHLDANSVIREITSADMSQFAGDFVTMDGGRVLMKGDFNNLCYAKKLWMAPRLWCMAPWMQVRFQDVVCATPSGPLSPNPADTSFFPLTSFSAAECP